MLDCIQESTTEAVAPTTPIQYTRKRGSQPQIGLNEGYIVKYTLQVRMGDNGTKSTMEVSIALPPPRQAHALQNQINIDDSKTHKGQQKCTRFSYSIYAPHLAQQSSCHS